MVLFGSVARGDAHESSDIDLLVVADPLPRSMTDRARLLRQAWEQVRIERGLLPVEWNLVVKTPGEAMHHSPLYLDIVEDGILLVDRDGFFEDILEAMLGRMRALGSRRVYLPDDSWYRDLKPDYRFGEVVRDMTSTNMGRHYNRGSARPDRHRSAGPRAPALVHSGSRSPGSRRASAEGRVASGRRRTCAHPRRGRAPAACGRPVPAWMRNEIAHLAAISTEMAGDRGLAFYGDERQALGPQELFDESDASRAVSNLEYVAGLVTRLLTEHGSTHPPSAPSSDSKAG